MKKISIIGIAFSTLLLTGCDRQITSEEIMQKDCLDRGAVYFESEDTSAGNHVWCVMPGGEDVGKDLVRGSD